MKTLIRTFAFLFACLALFSVHAQPGGRGMMVGPRSMQFNAAMTKVFGDNSAFTATMENQTKVGETPMNISGKVAFDAGKYRFEADSNPMASRMPPEAAERMKAMGISLDHMVMISRPDKKLSYMIFPGMQAYFENPMQDPDADKPQSDFKIETTELGKETVDGHACVKNKVVVTDDKGKPHEFTLWNATDMKKFPIKLETIERGNNVTVLFKDVKLAKPDAAVFEPPADFKRYDNQAQMMQQEIMKRMGANGQGAPPKQ